MNTLLKTLSEKYGARSTGEKTFIDAHPIQKIADRNGNKDDIFNGNIKKAPARRGDQNNVDSTSVDHVDPAMKRFYDLWGASGGYGRDPQIKEMADGDPTHRIQFTKGKIVGARQHHYEEVSAENENEAIKKAKKNFSEPGYRISHVHEYSNHLGEEVKDNWINFADGTSVKPDPAMQDAIDSVRSSLSEENLAKFDMLLHANMSSYEKALSFVLKTIKEAKVIEIGANGREVLSNDRESRGKFDKNHPYTKNHAMYVNSIRNYINGINEHFSKHLGEVGQSRPSGNDVDRMHALSSYLGDAHKFITSGKTHG